MNDRSFAGLRIGEVARRTGVAVATLRSWEARYGALRPHRTAGGQRIYSEADVIRIRLIRERVEQGWLVSAAVADVVAQDERDEGSPAPGAAAAGDAQPLPLGLDLAGSLEAIDPAVALAAYITVRAMLQADQPSQVRDAVVGLVTRLGGRVGPAAVQDEEVIPVDVSFGAGPPLLPRAPAGSIARMRLESILPGLVEDARNLLIRLQPPRRREPRSAPRGQVG